MAGCPVKAAQPIGPKMRARWRYLAQAREVPRLLRSVVSQARGALSGILLVAALIAHLAGPARAERGGPWRQQPSGQE